jgi:hypothetical protein
MKTLATFLYRGNADTGATLEYVINAYTKVTYETGSIYQATAYVGLNSDGTITASLTNKGSSAWHQTPAAGVGSSFWALLTVGTGTIGTGTTGSRVSLASGQAWSITTEGSGQSRVKTFTGTMEIWDAASGGNLMSSAPVTMEARVYEREEQIIDGIVGFE